MKAIWKFPLATDLEQSVPMPQGARILAVATQEGVPCLWAAVDPDAVTVERRISIRGTGHELLGDEGDYVGTVLVLADKLVLHVFAPPEALA